jgi:hypothetical protein
MSAVISATCCCGSIGRPDLRQCPVDFRLWRGDVRLTGVNRVVGAIMPTDWSKISPEVLENARNRGQEVDALFCSYAAGTLKVIPAGTRKDAIALFEKLMKWFDRQGFKSVQTQVLLGGEDHGGIMDLRLDGMAVDLKATSKVEQSAIMQVAAYMDLDVKSDDAAILHVTERIVEPRLVKLHQQDADDWQSILAAWRVVQRRRPTKEGDE